MTTGQRIKAARKAAGLTQKELGGKLGITYQTLAQWENDLRNPKLETLQRIAAALGTPLQELVDDWNAFDSEELKQIIIYGKGITDSLPPQEQVTSLQKPTYLPDNMRYCRNSLGMTQKALAEKTDIPVNTIRAYENGNSGKFITQENLEKISAVFGVPPQKLLGHSVTYEQIQPTFQENCIRRINDALCKLNILGQNKLAERAEELAEIPRYQAQQATQSTSEAQEGTDTTLAEMPSESPQKPPNEGAEGAMLVDVQDGAATIGMICPICGQHMVEDAETGNAYCRHCGLSSPFSQ